VSNDVLAIGSKIHIVQRRLFQQDVRRHFVGEITALTGLLLRTQGYTFVHNPGLNEYERRNEIRTRVFGLIDANLIINVLPEDADLEAIRYTLQNNRMVVTDGATFTMDVNEFGAMA
jgi:hypothetical protein